MTPALVPAGLPDWQASHQIINRHALQRDIGELAISTPVPQPDSASRVPTAGGHAIILSPSVTRSRESHAGGVLIDMA